MTKRSDICHKAHRYCAGCGKKHAVGQLQDMDGNECCPGEMFTRDRTKVKA